MELDELKDPALQGKLRGAKSPEELLAVAREEGCELSDAALESVAGGSFWDCSDNICGDYRGPELDPDPGWN